MSIPFSEPITGLVATLNFKRAISLIAVITIFGGAAWTLDYYTDYSRLTRLEKTVSMLERLDSLDRRGNLSPDLNQVRIKIAEQLSEQELAKPDNNPRRTGFTKWFSESWAKFLAGGLPWFILSLASLSGMLRGEKNALIGFIAFQFFTIFFGIITAVIPPTGYLVADYIIIPWAIMFSIGIVPISIGMISGFKKVRDESLRKAIMNNLRQISAAADQYFLENGVSQVAVRDIVGYEQGKYIKALTVADGESYAELIIKQGEPITVYRSSGEAVSLQY